MFSDDPNVNPEVEPGDSSPAFSSGALPDELSIAGMAMSQREAEQLGRFARTFGYDEVPDAALDALAGAMDVVLFPDDSTIVFPIRPGDGGGEGRAA